jgi:hypothetical protein
VNRRSAPAGWYSRCGAGELRNCYPNCFPGEPHPRARPAATPMTKVVFSVEPSTSDNGYFVPSMTILPSRP